MKGSKEDTCWAVMEPTPQGPGMRSFKPRDAVRLLHQINSDPWWPIQVFVFLGLISHRSPCAWEERGGLGAEGRGQVPVCRFLCLSFCLSVIFTNVGRFYLFIFIFFFSNQVCQIVPCRFGFSFLAQPVQMDFEHSVVHFGFQVSTKDCNFVGA